MLNVPKQKNIRLITAPPDKLCRDEFEEIIGPKIIHNKLKINMERVLVTANLEVVILK